MPKSDVATSDTNPIGQSVFLRRSSVKMAAQTIVIQQFFKPIKILKWKVREGNSMSVGRILLVYQFEGFDPDTEQRKLKATHVGIVSKLLRGEGDIVKTGEPLLELKACTHPTVMNDMCAECGADLRKENNGNVMIASVPVMHSIPELKVSEELAQKLGKADSDRLLKDRKLALLVDLDQTLIHTTNDNIPANIKDVYHFQLYGPASPWYHTRFRPRTNDFLFNVSQFFELHICTFGARNYAHMIAMLLDPEQQYFSNRILSRDECFDPTSKKANLKALFPCGDDMVCIIDDREDVWSHAFNLIHVKPYHFFQHTGDINAPPGLNKQENDDQACMDLTKIKEKSKENGNSLTETDEIDKCEGIDKSDEMYDPEFDEKDEILDDAESSESDNHEIEEPNGVLKPIDKSIDCNIERQKNMEKSAALFELEIEKEADESLPNADRGTKGTSTNKTIFIDEINGKIDTKRDQIEAEMELKQLENNECENSNNTGTKSENGEIQESDSRTIADNLSEIMKKSSEISKTQTKEENEISVKKELGNLKKVVLSSENNHSNEESCSIEDNKQDSSNKDSSEKLAINENKVTVDDVDGMIDVDDPDDYLLYLEDILRRIHSTFYEEYDERGDGSVPDLKQVIPRVRSQVLTNTKLVFSGLVPTHARLEESRAYQVAKALGAQVENDLRPDTTHLVAVRTGTAKVNAAKKRSGGVKKSKRDQLKVVTPDWLWCCAERWERVREEVFPLDNKGSKNRHPPPHCSSPEHNSTAYPTRETPSARKRTPSGRFMDTINPLMSFSSDDIADMDKEVEDTLDSEDSDSEVDNPSCSRNQRLPRQPGGESFEDRPIHPPKATDLTSLSGNVASVQRRKSPPISLMRSRSNSRSSDTSSSSAESLTGEYPRGFKRSYDRHIIERFHTSPDEINEAYDNIDRTVQDDKDISIDEEFPSAKFRRGEEWSSDLDIGQNSDGDGSEDPRDDNEDGEWNVMGAALEREFLSNN